MISICCDFDGTITSRDSIVFLTENYGGGHRFRSDALDRIQSGEWSVCEAIENELASVKISWEEVVPVLKKEITVDPFFVSFVSWTRQQEISLRIVSSGMRPVIELFVGHLGLEVYAHSVEIDTDGWHYRADPKMMKDRVLAKVRSDVEQLVYIGDGTSDLCAIPYADHLFAKRYLAKHCEENSICYYPFDTFDDVRSQLQMIF